MTYDVVAKIGEVKIVTANYLQRSDRYDVCKANRDYNDVDTSLNAAKIIETAASQI